MVSGIRAVATSLGAFIEGRGIPLNILYNLCDWCMTFATLSQFRSKQSEYIAAAQREPVEITSRGAARRAVLVSPEFYDRAVRALEDQADIHAAAEARRENGRVSHEELKRELGI